MATELTIATPSWSLFDAAKAMRKSHVSGLPVIDEESRLVGVLSEKDIFADLDQAVGIGKIRGLLDLLLELRGDVGSSRLEQCLRRLEHGKVGEAMTTRVVTTDPWASIGEAARLMREFSVKRLPVVSGNRLVGIVTRENIIEALSDPSLLIQHEEGPWSRHHLRSTPDTAPRITV
jgi:CBS domain-containing protein